VLALAGIRLHPALRAAIGAAVVAVALALALGAPVILLGAALLLWGLAGLAGLTSCRAEEDDRREEPRS
jgi:hypothetical protein